jgi:hypothetical protein
VALRARFARDCSFRKILILQKTDIKFKTENKCVGIITSVIPGSQDFSSASQDPSPFSSPAANHDASRYLPDTSDNG